MRLVSRKEHLSSSLLPKQVNLECLSVVWQLNVCGQQSDHSNHVLRDSSRSVGVRDVCTVALYVRPRGSIACEALCSVGRSWEKTD